MLLVLASVTSALSATTAAHAATRLILQPSGFLLIIYRLTFTLSKRTWENHPHHKLTHTNMKAAMLSATKIHSTR